MARWATLIRQRRKEKPVLLVDGGDFCSPWRMRYQDIKDRYFFDGMKRLQYDAIAVGENEIRLGRKQLLEAMKNADLPLVSSNIIDKRGNGHLAAPYIVKTVGKHPLFFWRREGIKIGILSVVLPLYIHEIDEEIHEYYDVQDTRISALAAVSALRKRGCDMIIALSHLGWENSLEFAKAVPGINIVINGHRSHNSLHHEYVGETIVIDTGINRASFAELEVMIEDNTPRYKAKDMGKVLLTLDGDPEFVALDKSYEEEIEASKMNTAKGER